MGLFGNDDDKKDEAATVTPDAANPVGSSDAPAAPSVPPSGGADEQGGISSLPTEPMPGAGDAPAEPQVGGGADGGVPPAPGPEDVGMGDEGQGGAPVPTDDPNAGPGATPQQ